MRPGVGGNRRAGLLAGGAILLILGMGGGVIFNLAIHQFASTLNPPCYSSAYLPVVCEGWGWGATIVLCLGAFAAIIGAAMISIGLQLPPMPLRLFDTEGKYPPDPSEP